MGPQVTSLEPTIERQGRNAGDKLAQQAKVFAAEPDNLNLMSKLKEENKLLQPVL